jgi:hypothetical protein
LGIPGWLGFHAGVAVDEHECGTIDAVVALPVDGEVGIGLVDVA